MVFDLLAPPKGAGTQKMVPYVSNSYTKSGWISEKHFFFTPTTPPPHVTPKSHPWGMTQAAKWKSRLICFISFICEKTHKIWFKSLWNWFSNWNLMISNDIWPFGGGGAKKRCRCTPHLCEQLTHQIWLDFVQWFRRRKHDGRTEVIAISLTLFYKTAWG